MGAYLSRPEKEKSHEEGENDFIRFAATSMQGWRTHQEDAHNCILSFGDECSLFAVYDGHGGSDVSSYLKKNFPDFLKEHNLLLHTTDEGLSAALHKLFVKFDETLRHDDTVKAMVELKTALSTTSDQQQQQTEEQKANEGCDPGEKERKERESLIEEAYALSQEANISLEQIIKRYTKCRNQLLERVADQISDQQQQDHSDSTEDSSINKHERKKRPIVFISPQLRKRVKIQQQLAEADSANDGDDDSEQKQQKEEKSPLAIPSDGKDDEMTNVHSQLEQKQQQQQKKQETEAKTADIPSDPFGNKSDVEEVTSSTLNGNLPEENNKCNSSSEIEHLNGEQQKQKKEKHEDGSDESKRSEKRRTKDEGNGDNSADTAPHSSTSDSTVDQIAASTAGENDEDGEEEEDDPDYKEENDTKMDGEETTSTEEEEAEEAAGETEEEHEEEEEEEEDEEEDDDDTGEDIDMLLNSSEGNKAGFDSGSTACVVLLFKDKLVVANIGDSRCVLCRAGKAVELSADHKPEDLKEKERIEAAGGSVSEDGRVNGGLNLTRAFGDHFYKQTERLPLKDQMITALPDVTVTERHAEADEFLIVACDGIWNSMTSQEACDFVSERISTNTLKQIGADICDHCCAKDTTGDGSGCDNETVIIIDLKKATRSAMCTDSAQ
ncbi:hypothetical protein niasHS_005399 [Heterodera schachtii]|uniref:protein-serine/threonine phosphatase n=1 Tax=Heterodera schachtii TaxID=97005 RepID=A0ABD2J967_HETSC